MKPISITKPELVLIAATRGMLGAGLALLLGERLSAEQRRAVGWTLFLVGALSTIPLAADVLGQLPTTRSGRKQTLAERRRARVAKRPVFSETKTEHFGTGSQGSPEDDAADDKADDADDKQDETDQDETDADSDESSDDEEGK